MQTTTIRLDDSMKERIAAAASHAGKSAHAFILDAISQTVEQVELDNQFSEVADERWKGILATGKTVSWEDTKAYLEAKARGENPSKPLARSSNH
jgi:uncharacterized protein (DUF1778 family)